MPCQRVLAPVTGAGPPQAAEPSAAGSLWAAAGIGEIPLVM